MIHQWNPGCCSCKHRKIFTVFVSFVSFAVSHYDWNASLIAPGSGSWKPEICIPFGEGCWAVGRILMLWFPKGILLCSQFDLHPIMLTVWPPCQQHYKQLRSFWHKAGVLVQSFRTVTCNKYSDLNLHACSVISIFGHSWHKSISFPCSKFSQENIHFVRVC